MRILIVIFLLCAFCSCNDEWKKKDEVTGGGLKKGTAYEILQERGNFNVFLDAVNRVGYRDLLDGKGLSTLFVPNDDSFKAYFTKHGVATLDDIDAKELEQLIGGHILKFAYREEELNNFQPQTGMENLPGVNYKHPAVITPPIREFYSPKTRRNMKVYSNQKYLPVFTTNIFTSLGISAAANYEYFYPGSAWNASMGIAVANAQVIESQIATDNGYLYIVDQVIEPANTVYGAIENDEDYSTIKNMYDEFLSFSYNKDASNKYAEKGDSLFTMGVESTKNFPLSNLADEWTSNGVWETPQFADAFNAFLPTNDALNQFFYEYWQDPNGVDNRYESYDKLDKLVKYYLLENHVLLSNPAFPERITTVLRNSWGYNYTFDPQVNGVRKEMCGNGVFIGIDKVQEPAIFNSVTRPVFQSPSFKIFSYMLAKSGLLPELANMESEVTLFIPSDDALNTAKYTLYDPGTTLENVQIRNNGTNMATAELTNFIRGHLLPGRLEEAELDHSESVWYETQKAGNFLKIGDGKITLENQVDKAEIVNRFAYSGIWTAYEVNNIVIAGKNWLQLVEMKTPYAYYTWLKDYYKEKIIKNTSYFKNGTSPLQVFAVNRGVIFTGHAAWAKPGQNDVPKVSTPVTNSEKLELGKWLDKHVLTLEENPAMQLIDFVTGEKLLGQSFQTHSEGVSIKVVGVDECTDAPATAGGETEKDLGELKLTIEVTTTGKQPCTAVAYGPHLATDCIFFLIRNSEERFVYSE